MTIKIGKNLNIEVPTPCPAWNNIEVHPVKEFKKGTKNAFCEQCEPKEADFWSVFLHLTEGGLLCVADLPTEELANDLEQLLMLTQKAYTTVKL